MSETFGELVKRKRLELRIGLREFSENVNVPASVESKIERGIAPAPTGLPLLTYMRVLGMDTTDELIADMEHLVAEANANIPLEDPDEVFLSGKMPLFCCLADDSPILDSQRPQPAHTPEHTSYFENTESQDVLDFLEEFPDVKKVLCSAQQPLNFAFGYQPEIDLRIIVDPNDGKRDALAVLRFSTKVKDAYEALNRFNKDWWWGNLQFADYRLFFMLEPISSNESLNDLPPFHLYCSPGDSEWTCRYEGQVNKTSDLLYVLNGLPQTLVSTLHKYRNILQEMKLHRWHIAIHNKTLGGRQSDKPTATWNVIATKNGAATYELRGDELEPLLKALV